MKYSFLLFITLFISCTVQNKISESASTPTTTPKPTPENTPKISKMEFTNRIDSTRLMKDLKYLSSDELGGRETESEGNKIAQNYILRRFAKYGLKEFNQMRTQDFTFSVGGKNWKGKNLLGQISGTKSPEKFIILTAHYDHVGTKKGEIYNGADDNASGICALLAAAEWFAKNPPNNTIAFIAFDGEEMGLQGAKYFVKNLPIKKEDIILNLNLDMISRNEQNDINICGTAHYPHLKKELEHLPKVTSLNVKYEHDRAIFGMGDWTNASDHGAFHQMKIPFLYLGVEDHVDYHKPTDDFENIDPSFYFRASNLVMEILMAFDKVGLE